jgi:hypothetical protein
MKSGCQRPKSMAEGKRKGTSATEFQFLMFNTVAFLQPNAFARRNSAFFCSFQIIFAV